jgi:prolyl oligopeptidase
VFDPELVDPSGGTRLGYFAPSTDGRLVAYQVATDGGEEFTLRIKDADSGADLAESLPGCRYSSVAWRPDTDAFYYTHTASTAPDQPRVYLHRVGSDFAEDAEVFGADLAEADGLDIAVAPDGSVLVVSATTGLSAGNQLWVGPLDENPQLSRLTVAEDGWTGVWPGRRGRLYLLTDAKAPRNQLLVLDAPGTQARCLVPEDPRSTLESFAVLGEDGPEPELLALWSADGTSAITRHDLDSGQMLGRVPLPRNGVITEFTFGDGSGDQVWFTYSDRVTPETVYTYRRGADRCTPWLPLDRIEPLDIVVGTEDFRSADGTSIRLLLVGPASAPPGPLPTILEGYGAFGVAQVPEYYAAALVWARQGGLFAVACVRGGGEHGEDWHRAGMRQRKQCGIDDFIGAARHLIDSGHTRPALLGAFGQSAGGLLAAAAMTQRPDLFGAMACTAAPLDMARYELSGFGSYWVEEFGSRENPDDLAALLAYSPYHHVRDVAYPAVLLSTFEQDSRVDPLHARKMCAALQAVGSPALLRRDATAGHGERDRTGRLAYFTDVLAFFQQSLNRPRVG